MRIRFNDAATRELGEAAAHYDAERPGLSEAFLAAIEAATQAVDEAPMR